MRWCRVRVSGNVIIRVSQKLGIKANQIRRKHTQSQSSPQIFSIEVWIEVYQICLSVDSQRICRSILVQSRKVNQTQSSQQEGEKVMKRKEAVLSWIIDGESTPQPPDNPCSDNGLSTPQASNYSSTPKGHLTPWLHISNKSGLNHNLQNNNSNQPYKFTGLSVTCVIQPAEKMHINYNKKQRPSVCMQITQGPSIRHVTHQMLNTMKCHINMWCIMHCLKNTSPNLQNKSQSCQYPPIVISIQIGRCRITNQVILHYILHGLIPLASAQFFKRSFH